jgi:hypothetical protein
MVTDEQRREMLAAVYEFLLKLPTKSIADPAADNDQDRLLTERIGESRSIKIVPELISDLGGK